MGLGAASSNIGTSTPNRCHDTQLLGNFLERGILWKPLKGVNYGLFVRHRKKVPLCSAGCKRALKGLALKGTSIIRANCYLVLSACCVWSVAFPLTPALSPRESENLRQSVDQSSGVGKFESRHWFPPLPRG